MTDGRKSAGDSMPVNHGLQVGPYVSGVTTAIHNNGYVVMLIGSERPSCITDELARRSMRTSREDFVRL